MIELLILSFCTVLLGPIIYQVADQKGFAHSFLDTFIIFSVFGLALFHVIPESIEHGGTWAMVAAFVGFIGPIVIANFTGGSCNMSTSLISLATVGLFAHSILDGLALSATADASSKAMILGLAVILHRLPEGVGIWRFVTPRLGVKVSIAFLALDLLGTTLGYFFGHQIITILPEDSLIIFQALMAGTLLHVMFHRHHIEPENKHEHTCCDHDIKPLNSRLGKGLGAITGGLLVCALWAIHPEHDHADHGHHHHHDADHS